jgi:hypothetical protein
MQKTRLRLMMWGMRHLWLKLVNSVLRHGWKRSATHARQDASRWDTKDREYASNCTEHTISCCRQYWKRWLALHQGRQNVYTAFRMYWWSTVRGWERQEICRFPPSWCCLNGMGTAQVHQCIHACIFTYHLLPPPCSFAAAVMNLNPIKFPSTRYAFKATFQFFLCTALAY